MSIVCPESLAGIVALFEKMSPSKLDRLGEVYAPNVTFRDPIQECTGLERLRSIYQDMLAKLDKLSVDVIDAHGDESTGFLLWTMHYQWRGKNRTLTGTSHFKFARDGRVSAQTDHWDATFALYGDFPVLGWVLRKLQASFQTK